MRVGVRVFFFLLPRRCVAGEPLRHNNNFSLSIPDCCLRRNTYTLPCVRLSIIYSCVLAVQAFVGADPHTGNDAERESLARSLELSLRHDDYCCRSQIAVFDEKLLLPFLVFDETYLPLP